MPYNSQSRACRGFGVRGGGRVAATTLSVALDAYLEHRTVHYAASTVQNEGFVLRRFVAWYGDVQVRNLRPEKVQDWFLHELAKDHVTKGRRRRPPVAPSTYNYYRSRLRSFFEFCRGMGWTREDPLRLVMKRRLAPRSRDILTPTEVQSLIDAASNERDRAFLTTAANTGLRSGELRRLRVKDVDLRGGFLSVIITKSATTDEMPISADLDSALSHWLRCYALDLGRPLRGDDYLFPARSAPSFAWTTDDEGGRRSRTTEGRWKPGSPLTKAERIVQAALAAIGRPTGNEGVHALRRAAARALFDLLSTQDSGYDAALRTVSAFLHHRSSATTEHYLGLKSERLRRDEVLRGQPFMSRLAASDAAVVDFTGVTFT